MSDPGDSDEGPALDLYLLRHADAGDPYAWKGEDAARPLSGKGRRQAERLGAHLARIGLQVDVILSSPKLRALETATIVGDAIGAKPEIEDRLGQALSIGVLNDLLGRRARGPDGSALLVGHDPDFSELLAELLGVDDLPLRKGALARLEAEQPLTPAGATIRWIVPPDLLKPAKP
jgi:phosphohistidine phosphatase